MLIRPCTSWGFSILLILVLCLWHNLTICVALCKFNTDICCSVYADFEELMPPNVFVCLFIAAYHIYNLYGIFCRYNLQRPSTILYCTQAFKILHTQYICLYITVNCDMELKQQPIIKLKNCSKMRCRSGITFFQDPSSSVFPTFNLYNIITKALKNVLNLRYR